MRSLSCFLLTCVPLMSFLLNSQAITAVQKYIILCGVLVNASNIVYLRHPFVFASFYNLDTHIRIMEILSLLRSAHIKSLLNYSL